MGRRASGGSQRWAQRWARWTRPRRLLLVAGLSIVAYGALVAFFLLDARRAAYDGLDELKAARRELTVADLGRGAGEDRLRIAADAFGRASDRLSSPLLAPVRLLPFVGRQVRSASALTGAVHESVDLGADLVREGHRIIEGGLPPGPARVDALRQVARLASDGERMVAAIDLGPRDALLGPLGRARDRLATALDELRRGMHDAADGAGSMAEVMHGPTTWLLLATNNAEMRSGSGMFLSGATLRFADGHTTLSDVRPLSDMVLADPVPVTDPDLASRWGWTGLDRDFRNLALSPRFPATAEQAARMWTASTGEHIDGVVAIDVQGLADLLGAVGPVDVDGLQVGELDAVSFLMHDQYVDLGSARDERRERLGRVAKAVFERVEQPGVDVAAIAQAVRDSTQGRHLLVWSADAALQAAWERVGVGGALHPDSVLVAVSNRGGNKLDQRLVVTSRLDTVASTANGGGTDVTITIAMTNRASTTDPPYVLGANGGRYDGFLTIDLPRRATIVELAGTGQLAALGSDGPVSQVASRAVSIDVGTTATATLRFHLPADMRSVRIEPSARLPAVQWSWAGAGWFDVELAVVDFDRPGRVEAPDLPT